MKNKDFCGMREEEELVGDEVTVLKAWKAFYVNIFVIGIRVSRYIGD